MFVYFLGSIFEQKNSQARNHCHHDGEKQHSKLNRNRFIRFFSINRIHRMVVKARRAK